MRPVHADRPPCTISAINAHQTGKVPSCSSRHRPNAARRTQGGFTLVELLVVIVILGILAAIVVFAVGGITDKGQTSATSIDVTNLQVAEEAFFANGKPVGAYTPETNLLQTSYLRSTSVNNYFCLKPPVDATGLRYPDYFVLPAPLPA